MFPVQKEGWGQCKTKSQQGKHQTHSSMWLGLWCCHLGSNSLGCFLLPLWCLQCRWPLSLVSSAVAFLGRCPMFWPLKHSWVLYCNLGFSFPASCMVLESLVAGNLNPSTHCLDLAAFWNFGARFSDPLAFPSFMPTKTVPCGWYSQFCWLQM